MVFKVQLVIKFFFKCLVILLLFFNNVHSDDSVRLKWLELVPKFAYDFVPESGVTEEMWEDEIFLQKVEKAGLLINDEVVGKKIQIDGFMVPLEFDYGEGQLETGLILNINKIPIDISFRYNFDDPSWSGIRIGTGIRF